MSRALPALALTGALLAVSGCGNQRTQPPPPPAAAAVGAAVPVRYGPVALRVPGNWHRAGGRAPLVATVASGPASVAVWRYPRSEPLPTGARALVAARDALVRDIIARDHTARIASVSLTTVGGHDAIVVRATESVDGTRREVRSTHVYADRAEIVVDALAPPAVFAGLDRAVFSPLTRSLRVGSGAA